MGVEEMFQYLAQVIYNKHTANTTSSMRASKDGESSFGFELVEDEERIRLRSSDRRSQMLDESSECKC